MTDGLTLNQLAEKNALLVSDVEQLNKKILAYEQAAKNPVMYKVVSLFGDISYQKQKCKEGLFSVSVTPLYAAPVLPKQPECEIPFGDVEPMEVTDNMVFAFHDSTSDEPLTDDEFRDIKQGLCAALMNTPRPAKPTIPEPKYADFHDWLKDQKPYAYKVVSGELEASEDEVVNAKVTIVDMGMGWKAAVQFSAQPVNGSKPVGYFSYGSEHGFDWHETEKEAIESAEAAIDDYRGDASDGWSEETDSICWGVILQNATKVDERPRTDDDKCDPAIDTVCDYALLPALEG